MFHREVNSAENKRRMWVKAVNCVSDRSDLYFNKCFALVSSASSWNEQCRTAAVIVVTDGVIDRRRGNVNGALWLKVASICPSVCFGAIQLN